MSDWRLQDPPEFLQNQTVKMIVFPDFWKKSFNEKNDFFKMIKSDGENFVKEYGRDAEYLAGDKIQDFWHEHCVFCTKKITTRDDVHCFCTEDYRTWICQACYDDFNRMFNLNLIK